MKQTLIPKIIHYFYDDVDIWKKDTKSQTRMCVNSWLKFCPEYKLMLWHDKMPEFQEILKKSKFVQKAYELKLWAFVSDYVRLYALYKYGGIYLDTDIELINNFDKFLNNKFFTSIEGDILFGENIPEPALIGCIPRHPLIKKTMQIYESDDIFGIDNFIANVIMKRALVQRYGFTTINYRNINDNKKLQKYYDKLNPNAQLTDFDLYKKQSIWSDARKEITIFPCRYFCPTWAVFHERAITKDTVAIHWNQSSWGNFKKIKQLHSFQYKWKLTRWLFVHHGNLLKILKK